MTRAILTCSPHFEALALNEIRRFHLQSTASRSLFPGYILLDTPVSFDQLTAPWRHRLPIYLHHCFPVQDVVALDADIEPLRHKVRQHSTSVTMQIRSLIEPDQLFCLSELNAALYASSVSSLRPPSGRVLSILVVPESTGVCAYLGTSNAVDNLSPWQGGQIPITEPVSNRAGYKLLEALNAFSIRLRPGDHALDLGASPGAWTTLLRRRQLKVTAVAPTPLYPWLTCDDGVTHQAMRAEIYLERCQTTFDMIVNDMKLDAQDSARLMVDYAAHLRADGLALMTLKLRERNQRQVMDHSFRILRKAYKILRVRQLVSNRLEVTLFLRRLP